MTFARITKRLALVKYPCMLCGILVASLLIATAIFGVGVRTVTISDNGKLYEVTTTSKTVGEVLQRAGIVVNDYDFMSVNKTTVLKAQNDINIKRAISIEINVGGEIKKYWTLKNTISEIRAENKITMSGDDRLEGASLDDQIQKNMQLAIVRVADVVVTETEEIPFEVDRIKNSDMDKGIEKTVKIGVNGINEKEYKLVLENGKEIGRELLTENIKSQPVNKVVEYGTVSNFQTSRGNLLRYTSEIDVLATAYTNSSKWGNRTYSSRPTRPGIIAVDPAVIPLGTKLYVEGQNGANDYGYAIAADIGKGVNGNEVDLWMSDYNVCMNWGVKKCKVYILKDQSVDVFALRE